MDSITIQALAIRDARIVLLETRMQKLRNIIYRLQCGERITIDEWEEQCTWFNDDGTPK